MSNRPNIPPPDYGIGYTQTITILERVSLPALATEALTLRRVEPAKPTDILDFQGRKN